MRDLPAEPSPEEIHPTILTPKPPRSAASAILSQQSQNSRKDPMGPRESGPIVSDQFYNPHLTWAFRVQDTRDDSHVLSPSCTSSPVKPSFPAIDVAPPLGVETINERTTSRTSPAKSPW